MLQRIWKWTVRNWPPLCLATDPGYGRHRITLVSVARIAVVPVQDVLALGSEARMNFPGRPHGNWSWRLRPGQLTPAHAARLRALTELYGRLAAPPAGEA
jgi:4-alpha-glucanotransferase